eukprot:CAMPEP_0172154666 /NCGR_PEP_ID=MMETSP1050-20130122/2167_1 /TAXON_ID=233186 /ORGANISM="Cryptomonas curvata, Strain CCAP979/52" /LENGTH=121 /DNA_ID=CAMNT_0012823419 /DNA_START=510 /DNA_END=872 /DNA_ORIENTATION=+
MILLKAAHFGVDEVIKPLLDAGADINYIGKRGTGCPMNLVGLTPLSAAAHRGRSDCVISLLALGANVTCGRDAAPAGGRRFWMELSGTVARRREALAKAEDIKSRPFTGNGRRDPGKRKTR